ncbi:MAG: hypothetical protein IKW00_05680 [Clostridia bacterium]|nr:hypothetical protein [Clostridia bacterium]
MSTTTYKCPACGSPLLWGSDGVKCPGCDNEYKAEDIQQYAEALEKNEQPSRMEWGGFENHPVFSGEEAESMRMFNCTTCGAELMTDQNTAATRCVYCGSPALIPERFEGDLRPDAVIPFVVSREEAEQKLRAHFHGKKLLPDDFIRNCHVEEVTGLYVPYYLFDCKADARMTYRATRVSTRRRGEYMYTYTRHYYIVREGAVEFSRIPVDASSRVDNVLTEAIEPFDYNALCDFQMPYMSGFQADKRNESIDSCVPRINQRVEESTRDAFRDTVAGYATVVNDGAQLNMTQGDTRYVLLPVWLFTVRYGENSFPFAVNGQTGKLVGELPVDKKKYRLLKLKLCAGAAAAIFAILSLLGV